MRKTLWLFLTKLLIYTVAFGLVWFLWLKAQYPLLLRPLGDWLLPLFGAHKWHLTWTLEHFANMGPYIALVLATPGFGRQWKRGAVALAGGLAILVAFHYVMLISFYHIMAHWGLSEISYRWTTPIYIINDSLPLILWLVFYPSVISQLLESYRSRPKRS